MDSSDTQFYDQNAAVYAVRDRSLPQRRLDAFLNALPAGASILELGCGGGQDAAYMISRGFNVTPTDGSPEMAQQAEKLIGKPVIVRRFEELEDDQIHDGIWAEASPTACAAIGSSRDIQPHPQGLEARRHISRQLQSRRHRGLRQLRPILQLPLGRLA